MKTLKSILAIILALTLLCGCVPAESGTPEEENANLNDVEDSDVLPDIDDDLNDEIVPIVEPDIEDDGGVVLDEPVEYSSQMIESENDEFKLTLFNAKDRYTSDENIEIEAMVSLIAGEKLTVWSGDPILGFSLEGDTCFDNEQGSGMTMDILMSTVFTNVEDAIFPYNKSGGWSASDPYNAFYTDFFNDRDSFKLPAGNYTVTAYLNYSLDENDVIGTRRNLKASVSFTVEGKTLADLGYYPQEAEEQPNQEVIVEEDVVVEVPEIGEMLDVEPLVNVNYPDSNKIRNVEGRGEGVDQFTAQTVKEILLANTEENTIYSPLNVYLALGMLAEITDGETRQQVLDLVGAETIDELRTSAYALWCHNYVDDRRSTSLLGSSVWIDDSVKFKEGVGENLAQHYFAESYNCDVGSEEMLEAYKRWLNLHTGGLLKDAVEGTKFDPETVLVMATTIYYKAGWDNEFSKTRTLPDIFTLADGTELECDFLNGYAGNVVYYSDNFSATSKSLNDGGNMWFILPDEDVTLAELLEDNKMTEFITSNKKDFERQYADVILSLPKFDVKSNISLNDALMNMGVTNAYDSSVSEFLIDSAYPLYVSNVKHAARVKIDEQGIEAAAYTEIEVPAKAAAEPLPIIEFTLDRPFIFAITGATGDVLFVGVVNNPVV